MPRNANTKMKTSVKQRTSKVFQFTENFRRYSRCWKNYTSPSTSQEAKKEKTFRHGKWTVGATEIAQGKLLPRLVKIVAEKTRMHNHKVRNKDIIRAERKTVHASSFQQERKFCVNILARETLKPLVHMAKTSKSKLLPRGASHTSPYNKKRKSTRKTEKIYKKAESQWKFSTVPYPHTCIRVCILTGPSLDRPS
jgi:hypothetical protein